jgi:Asp-tRNA(Asn)/Glu-tRNA(Gln) amidotransferase A subunit family amidase
VTLPTHVGRNGLPVGVLLVGPLRGDDALLATARWVEERLTT